MKNDTPTCTKSPTANDELDKAAAYFSQRLRELLKQRNLRQSDVARAMGVAPSTVHFWLSGHSTPEPLRLIQLANVLQVDVGDLFPHKYSRRGLTWYPAGGSRRPGASEQYLTIRNMQYEVLWWLNEPVLGDPVGWYAYSPERGYYRAKGVQAWACLPYDIEKVLQAVRRRKKVED